MRKDSDSVPDAGAWKQAQDRIRQDFYDSLGREVIYLEDLITVLSRLGVGGADSEQVVRSSGALSPAGGQVDLQYFLTYLGGLRDPSPTALALPPAASSECRFRIFQINDVYILDNFPALKTCINELSKGFPPSNVLTTLAGDFLAPSLLSSLDHGAGMVMVMNAIPIHAVCFGNHECDVSHQALLSRIEEFNGVWLNSNMRSFNESEKLLEGKLPDNHLIKLKGGRSVALIGLLLGGGDAASIYRNGSFNGHAEKITPVLDAVDDAVSRVKAAYPKVDCVIPLTHQDVADDRKLTSRDFPVVLGGHDHGVFEELSNGTLVIKAGADAWKVAVIDIVWEAGAPPAPSPPTSVSRRLIQLGQPEDHKGPAMELKYSEDPVIKKLVYDRQSPARELQEAVLARLEPNPLISSKGVRKQECTMARLLCTAMRDVNNCDGAVMHAGGVRGDKDYKDGVICYADLKKECPFPSALIVVRIEGAVLSDAVARSRQPWRSGASSGFALHGDDKMKIDPDTFAVLEVAGEPLVPDKIYGILFDSYVMNTDEIPELKEYKAKYPDRVPQDDSGQEALPILVKYFCDKVWNDLLDFDKNGTISRSRIDSFFHDADKDNSGFLDVKELLAAMKKRTNDRHLASRVLAENCLNMADTINQDGRVSKKELIKYFKAEALEHKHPKHTLVD